MTANIDKVIRDMYEKRVDYLRGKNIELEREYFTENVATVPMGFVMKGASFDDHFESFKEAVKNGSEYEIDQSYMILQEFYLFSAGHDMMFKHKLKADIFNSVPIEELIYPRLVEDVKEDYNDVSVMKENPNYDSNIDGIAKKVYTYTELQSLLYFLYCYDFQFPFGWQRLYEDTHHDLIDILNKSEMTIGDFLHALVDYKCNIMDGILDEISDEQLRTNFLQKAAKLREDKHKETSGFAHVDLPVTYFLDHTMIDFINMKPKSSILSEDKPKTGSRKIILPNNKKR